MPKENKGGRVVILLVLALLLLAGGGYVAAYFGAKDRVPRGTTIEGVEVGGKTQAGAEKALRAELEGRAGQPLDVTLDGKEESLSPDEAGLAVDYAASVAEVGGRRSWDPAWLWDYYNGGDDVDAVTTVDDDALTAALEKLGAGVEQEAVDGAVRFKGANVRVRQPKVGRELDLDGARDAVTAAYLTDEPAELDRRRGPARDRARRRAEGRQRVRQPGGFRAGDAHLRRGVGEAGAAPVHASALLGREGRRTRPGARREEAVRAGRRARLRRPVPRSTRPCAWSTGPLRSCPASPVSPMRTPTSRRPS